MLARDYKVRVFIVYLCFISLFVIIGIRLFLIQIRQKDFFQILAKQQYELELTLNPRRALIYDATGKIPLAFNREVSSAFLVPQQLTEPQKTLRFVRNNYPDVYERIKQNPDKQFLWLDRKLTPKKYAQLVQLGLQDIHFIGEFQRFYPYESAAQLIGFTDIDNGGTAGLELEFSKYLGGLPARIRMEKDARSGMLYFEKMVRRQGQKGKSLSLTIDSSLQTMAFEELKFAVEGFGAKAGSAVVIDPDNGAVIAMVNFPTFDPNNKSVPAFELMKNNVVCECYELGSVMKAFCAMAAFEEGVVGFDEPIDCEGRFGFVNGVKVENPTIALLNALAEHNNILPFNDVIRYSSNVGIAKVATRLGPKLYTHLRRMGFGSKTNIQFPGERSGFVNPPERWSKPSLIVMSFGYELMATLMQLTKAFCIIANGGYDVQPSLIKVADAPGAVHKKIYKDSTVALMKRILSRVCERYPMSGFQLMGKTGTARCVKDGRYSNKAHNYTFGGIVEKGDYRRVIVTFIKEPAKAGLWASEVALPLFRKIAERMVVHDRVHHHRAI